MSKLHLYIGRANSLKSSKLYESITNVIREGNHAYLITPEQSSYVAEKRLSGKAEHGLFGSEVLSIDYLYERVLKEAGENTPFLSEQGLSMAIRKIAENNLDSLSAFHNAVHHPGFCSELAGMMSLFKRSSISPEILKVTLEKLPDGTMLKEKIQDLSMLYQESDSFLESRYMTLDDRANTAISLISHSFLRDSYVFFDDISGTDNQFFSLIREILLYAKEVTFSITDDSEDTDNELFLPAKNLEEKLIALASETGSSLQTTYFSEPDKRDPSLVHLDKHLFTYPYQKYEGTTNCIFLTAAASRQAEADYVCDSILKDVRSGARYRDIAIVSTDPNGYQMVLKRALELREIPYFLDNKKPAVYHPATDLIQCALNAVHDNFTASDILQLAKSSYAGVSDEESESLENYVLRYNIRSSMFFGEFAHKKESPTAESARKKLIPPLLKLREELHSALTSEKLEALYNYLVEIHLPEQLHERSIQLVEDGRPREAMEHSELWHLITDLFDQLYTILGDTKINREDFLSVVKEGLSGLSIGAIPDTADRILVGDISRTRLSGKISYMYIMGANDGLLPPARYDDSIIDDSELGILQDAGLPIWMKTSEYSSVDLYNIYCLFGAVTKKLSVSYSFSSGGKELTPSPIVKRMQEMFKDMSHNVILDTDFRTPEHERIGLRTLSNVMRDYSDSYQKKESLSELLKRYKENPKYQNTVSLLERNSKGLISPEPLKKSLAHAVYGESTHISASRLEAFNTCEFRHFLNYGLKAKLRPEAREKMTDTGTLYHAILQGFLAYCEQNAIQIRDVSEDRIPFILEDILPAILADHKEGTLLEDERYQATLFLIKETAVQTIHALVSQIKAGQFNPIGAEIHFGKDQMFPPISISLEDGRTMTIEGIIDRVDKAENDTKEFLRVIDYKTNGKAFDFSAILAGVSLQLPLYLKAVTTLQGTPAAMYYMPIKVSQPKDGDDILSTLTKNFKLKGLTLDDPTILECTAASENGKSKTSTILSTKKCSGSEMLSILNKAKAIAESTGNRIFAGEIAVNPTTNACKYCEYRSICRFDSKLKSCRTRKIPSIKQEDFFQLIEGSEIHG